MTADDPRHDETELYPAESVDLGQITRNGYKADESRNQLAISRRSQLTVSHLYYNFQFLAKCHHQPLPYNNRPYFIQTPTTIFTPNFTFGKKAFKKFHSNFTLKFTPTHKFLEKFNSAKNFS